MPYFKPQPPRPNPEYMKRLSIPSDALNPRRIEYYNALLDFNIKGK
jgi:hypothetical protein